METILDTLPHYDDVANPVRKGKGAHYCYVAYCGRAHRCSGMLGDLRKPFGASLITLAYRIPALLAEARKRPNDWILSHRSGYRRDGDVYRIIQDKPIPANEQGRLQRRRGLGGARPVPEHLQTPTIRHQGGYGIVGEHPELPAVVVCPHCGRHQLVRGPVESTQN